MPTGSNIGSRGARVKNGKKITQQTNKGHSTFAAVITNRVESSRSKRGIVSRELNPSTVELIRPIVVQRCSTSACELLIYYLVLNRNK